MTEIEIINGCIKKDRRCQNALYKNYFPLLSSIALRYCANKEDAMHGLNYGFLKILTNIKDYNSKHALATWMRNILVNHLIDEFRKNQKYITSIHLVGGESLDKAIDTNLVEKKWEENQLRSMLNKLPNVTKNVFNLYAIDGYKHKEIAEMLSISIGTSKWHVSDARRKLKEQMEAQLAREKKRNELAAEVK
jgi:RNA polymerase sigma factor (sigma-70 family)